MIWQAGRIQTTPEALRAFADSLCATDEVALEATGNTDAIARLLERQVGRVVVSNPQKTRATAEARSRPTRSTRRCWRGCWQPTTRLKNQVQSILHRNLIGRCPAADLFDTKGRAWLATQDLPADEHQAVGALLRAFYERVRARRGMQVAVVATARKLATLCWHLVVGNQDYAFQRPSLTDKKLRAQQLRAGMPPRRGRKGAAAAYSLKEAADASGRSPSRPKSLTASSSPTGNRSASDQAPMTA